MSQLPLKDIIRLNEKIEKLNETIDNLIKPIDGSNAIMVDDSYFNKSVPTSLTGNTTEEIIPAGAKCIIRAIVIIGEGNVGSAEVKVGDTVVFPMWFSQTAKAITSPNLRLVVAADQAVTVTTEDRGGNKTFIGITYTDFHSA